MKVSTSGIAALKTGEGGGVRRLLACIVGYALYSSRHSVYKSLAGCGKRPPAAFSHHSEAQRTAQSTLRLFARCGLAGQPFCAFCMAVQRRLKPRYP